MKLYFSPGACSLSPHIALREAGLPFDLVKVDLRAHKLKDGADYYGLNPKGQVPVLELDNGERLTEVPAVVQYIADLAPASTLAPPAGSFARIRLQEWLNFITSELHKGLGSMFDSSMPAEWKQKTIDKLGRKFDYVVQKLGDKPYLLGDRFSVADAYLFTVLKWAKPLGMDTSRWPTLLAYIDRIAARPKVHEALAAEATA